MTATTQKQSTIQDIESHEGPSTLMPKQGYNATAT